MNLRYIIYILLVSLAVQIKAKPIAEYSRKMVESQGMARVQSVKWDYVPGLVAKSLTRAYLQYPEETWAQNAYAAAKAYADVSVDANGMTSKFVTGSIDNINAGKILFDIYAVEKEKSADASKRYKLAADSLYRYLRYHYSRIESGDGKGGFFHKNIYPYQMWLDGLYMGAAYYAEYVHNYIPEDTAAWSDIAMQFKIIHRHTYDKDVHLNYHGWSSMPTDKNCVFWANQSAPYLGCSSAFWGRGMGWYFAALVDVLEYMPTTHKDYEELRNILTQVAEGLAEWQDKESGVWYQLLMRDSSFKSAKGKSNYLESSASSMFTYAYFKAVRLNLLPQKYKETAEKAWQGLLKNFIRENDGVLSIIQSCKSAGLGPASDTSRDGSESYYLDGKDVTITKDEGKAIGPFIMASLEKELSISTATGVSITSKTTKKAQRKHHVSGDIYVVLTSKGYKKVRTR